MARTRIITFDYRKFIKIRREKRYEASIHRTQAKAYGISITAGSCQIANNRVTDSITPDDKPPPPLVDRRALFVSGQGHLESGYATIVDNAFSGFSRPPLVEIALATDSGFERITYSNNRTEHRWTHADPGQMATVSLRGTHLIVLGNHVKATQVTLPSMDFNNSHTIVPIGNVTTGDLRNPALSVAFKPLNVKL